MCALCDFICRRGGRGGKVLRDKCAEYGDEGVKQEEIRGEEGGEMVRVWPTWYCNDSVLAPSRGRDVTPTAATHYYPPFPHTHNLVIIMLVSCDSVEILLYHC